MLLTEVRTRRPGTSGAGMLPLLSHALDQAWRSRSGNTLTVADYERTGGIEGAVADSAQRAYDRLTAAQQTTARQIFTRLTAISSDGLRTIARASAARWASPCESCAGYERARECRPTARSASKARAVSSRRGVPSTRSTNVTFS